MRPRTLRRTALPAALLALVAACGGEAPPADLKYPKHGLLILSLDTLRADRLGVYGNQRGLSPHLDAFAEECVVFDDAFANSPKTASSHMTLFTSLLPTAHGVTNTSLREGVPAKMLADNRLTLAQILNRTGYWNAAIASGGNIQQFLGFAKGFGNHFTSGIRDVRDMVIEAEAVFDRARRQKAPWFFFLHTYQVHAPYVPPEPYLSRFSTRHEGLVADFVDRLAKLRPQEQWRAMHDLWKVEDQLTAEDARYLSELYDGEVAYMDSVLGDLFGFLRDKDLLDQMIVVVLSDHGEEFAEHGDWEHDQLYDEHLHIPLMIRLPHGHHGGTRVEGLTSLVDVMPTLLEMLDLPGPSPPKYQEMQGTSLVPAILSGRTRNAPVVAERVMYADKYQGALRSPDASVIFRAAIGTPVEGVEGTLEAHDLKADPGQQTDVAGTARWFCSAAGSLQQNLASIFALRFALDQVASGAEVEVPADILAQLEQLGYVEGGGEGGAPLMSWPVTWLAERCPKP